MTETKKFGDALKLCREKAGISQTELADGVRCTRQSISLLEAGQRDPQLTTILRLCTHLKVTIDVLTGQKPYSPTSNEQKPKQPPKDPATKSSTRRD